MQPFSVGSVLAPSFAIWLRNIIPFTILILLVQIPNIAYAYLILSGNPSDEALLWFVRIFPFTVQLLNLVATGALVYGVVQHLSKEPVGIGPCISKGLSRLLPVLGTGILASIAILLGFAALIVPGLIFACMFWVAVPVAVVEKPGSYGALKRSAELSKGSKWSIFVILLLLFVFAWLIDRLLYNALDDEQKYLWSSVIVDLVWGGMTATTAGVAYYQLRQSKEGVDIDELKAVFA